MTRHDISECLPFWDSLSAKSRQRLRENAIFRRYKPGENVIFKTVKKDGIVFVLEGKLRVYLSSGTGREITLFKLPKGEAFSIMTVDNARDNDVVPSLQSLDNTTLAYLQRSDMAPTAYEEPLMANFIFEACAKTGTAYSEQYLIFFFQHPAKLCRPCSSRTPQRRRSRSRRSAYNARGHCKRPWHNARGHQPRAGSHARYGSYLHRPRKDLYSRPRRTCRDSR